MHTHPAALRIAYRTHREGLILVTDAISAMGLTDGTHYIGQFAIDVRRGQAYVSGTNTLCGSIAPMDECVRIFREATGQLAATTIYRIALIILSCSTVKPTLTSRLFDCVRGRGGIIASSEMPEHRQSQRHTELWCRRRFCNARR